jgi:hypothetical protein
MNDDMQLLPERTASDQRGMQTAEHLHPVAGADAVNGG